MTLAIGNVFVGPERAVGRRMLGHDFLAFYTAGTFVREGRTGDLYNLDAVRQFERQVIERNHLEAGESFGPWWNPPFYAWVFVPLASLPYRAALNAWLAVNLAALAGAIVLLCRMLPAAADAGGWRTWGLVPLLIVTSMPFIQALSHGQNTFTSLLLLCGVVTAWRTRRGVIAGMVAGLLFYKPQLAAVLAGVLVLSLGWRALLGLSITGISLLGLTELTLPGALLDWLHRLPQNVRFMQVEHPYLWERHVTLKAFWRLLLQGRDPGDAWMLVTALTLLCAAAVAIGLLLVLLRQRRMGLAPDRLIAATVASMPLLMPFYFDYDLMLLAVPAALLASDRLRSARHADPADRWLLAAWTALFAWLLVNPGIARTTHVNLTVPLLCAVAGLLITRAWRAARQAEQVPAGTPPLRAAA